MDREKIDFDRFAEEAIEIAQNVFVRMYRVVHERLFNNGTISLLHKPEYYCDFENKICEYFLPSVINAEGRLRFHRIVIRILGEIREDTYRDEVNALKQQIHTPPGFVDSENIILIAPKATVKRIIRGFRHHPLARGYMTYIIVNRDPGVVWMRALSLLKRFWMRRFELFCDSLGITGLREELIDILRDNSLNSTLNNTLNASETLQATLNNMLSTISYFDDMLHMLHMNPLG